MFDQDGVLQFDSTSVEQHWIEPVMDRDYFQAQRMPGRGLFISRPYRSRLIGKDVIGLSRRITRPDGGFGGVVLATIQLSYFQELFGNLKLGPGAVLTLVKTDGTLVMRAHGGRIITSGNLSGSRVFEAIKDKRSGNYVGPSDIDQTERLVSFSRVGDLPLIIAIGIPSNEILADWAFKSTLVLSASSSCGSCGAGWRRRACCSPSTSSSSGCRPPTR